MVPGHKHLGFGEAVGFLIPSYMRNASDDAEPTTHHGFGKGLESQQFFRGLLSSCFLLASETPSKWRLYHSDILLSGQSND